MRISDVISNWLESRHGWIFPVLFWGIVTAISAVYNSSNQQRNAIELATDRGRHMFNVIQLTRHWNARHGGVYAPVSEYAQPNPYLKDPKRDVVTTEGLKLTKINPAYMTRQISELAKKEGVVFHITSLKPIRPLNAADEWETQALEQFENGVTELTKLVSSDSNALFRYMAPLKVKEACMKCHRQQGYQVGDIRGGISININSEKILAHVAENIRNLLILHVVFFLFIATLIVFFFRKNQQHLINLEETVDARTKELRQSQQQQLQMQEQLHQTQKMDALGRFASGIAHDFNNILWSIIGYAGMINDRFADDSSPKMKEYLSTILKASNRAKDLVAQIMHFTEGQSYQDSPLQFSPLVKQNIDSLLTILPAEIEIKEVYEEGLPDIRMDPEKLQHILVNLCINAADAMNGKGTLTIQLGWQKNMDINCAVCFKPVQGDWIELSVSDTGMGMSPDVQQKIFDPFYTTKETGKGTGLGLSVVQGIVESHDGHILVKSEQGKGTVVRLLFPPYK